MKITQEHERCIGCGACVAACPENWEMSSDGKASPKSRNSDAKCNKKAEEGCPVKCIKVSK